VTLRPDGSYAIDDAVVEAPMAEASRVMVDQPSRLSEEAVVCRGNSPKRCTEV
jgi:hypothetical protein